MHPSNTISRISDLVTVVSRVTNDADICLFVKSLPIAWCYGDAGILY